MSLAGLPAALRRLREDPRAPVRNTTSPGETLILRSIGHLLTSSSRLLSKLLITLSNLPPITLRSCPRRAVIACHDVLPARMVDRIVTGNFRIRLPYPIYPERW